METNDYDALLRALASQSLQVCTANRFNVVCDLKGHDYFVRAFTTGAASFGNGIDVNVIGSVRDPGFRVQGLKFRVQGLGFTWTPKVCKKMPLRLLSWVPGYYFTYFWGLGRA